MLNREQEAIEMADLLNDQVKKVNVYVRIAKQLWERKERLADVQGLLLRAAGIARYFEHIKEKAQILRRIAETLVEVGENEIAVRLLEEADAEMQLIEPTEAKVLALCELAAALYQTQKHAKAKELLVYAHRQTNSIKYNDEREHINALAKVAGTWAIIGDRHIAVKLLQEIGEMTKPTANPTDIKFEEVEIAWRRVVEAMVMAYEWDTASAEYISSMKYSWQLPYALMKMASFWVDVGERELALALLTNAVEVAKAIDRVFCDSMTMEHFRFYKRSDFISDYIKIEKHYGTLSEFAVEVHSMKEENLSIELLAQAMHNTRRIEFTIAMADVAVALIRIGEIDQADDLLGQIRKLAKAHSRTQKDIVQNMKALGKIALAQISVGNGDKAIELLEKINELVRYDLEYDVQFSDPIDLHDMSSWAWMMVAKAGPVSKNWDDAERALRSLSKAGAYVNRFGALDTVVEGHVANGLGERAIALVHTMDSLDESGKLSVLCRLARALARSGNKTEALTILDEAEMRVRSYKDDKRWQYDHDIIEVIRAWAEVEQWNRIEALAEISKEKHSVEGLCEAAIFVSKVGSKRKALRLLVEAKRLSQGVDRNGGEKALAKALAEIGLWKKAFKIALSYNPNITTIGGVSPLVIEIATKLVKAGELDRAEEPGFPIGAKTNDRRLFAAMSIALAEMGNWGEAEKNIDSMNNDNDKVVVLSKVATLLNAAGDKERAVKLLKEAEKIIAPTGWETLDSWAAKSGNTARADLSLALAEVGLWDKAEKMAQSINDGRSNALQRLATIMVQAGKKLQSLQLVQRLWLEANTRELVTAYLSVGEPLIFLKPEIASEFTDAVKWVKNFLNEI